MGPRVLLLIALGAMLAPLAALAPMVGVFVLGAGAGAVGALGLVWHVLPSTVRPWVRAALADRVGR